MIYFNSFFKQIFRMVVLLCPFIVGGLICYNDYASFDIEVLNFIFNFSINHLNKPICYAFCLVTIAANIYNFDKKQPFIIIIGNLYFIASIGSSCADDWLSMFFFLELMMIFASILIFIGEDQLNSRLAQQYFLTHLFSGSLILIGITHIISLTGNTKMVELTSLLQDPIIDSSFIACSALLFGLLINVAAFPFCFWMVNCYPYARANSLMYLINFTSKVALLMIIKLFWGLKILEIFGMLTIIYGTFKALRENNIRKLLCFLTLSQLGIMLVGVSTGNASVTNYVILYIVIHILYKCLFSICFGILSAKNIIYCTDLKKIDHAFLLKISLLIASITMVSLPFTATFYAKKTILVSVSNLTYYVTIIPTILLFCMLPIREYVNSFGRINIVLSACDKWSLVLLIFSIFIFNFCFFIINYFDYWSFKLASISIYSITKSLSFIAAAIVIYKICYGFTRTHIRVETNFSYRLLSGEIFNYYMVKISSLMPRNQTLKNQLSDNFNYKTYFKDQSFSKNFASLSSTLYITFTLLLFLLLTLHYR